MSAAVQFDHVTKRFTLQHERARTFKEAFVGLVRRDPTRREELVALDDVSFEVAPGMTLGLVGPNGTGKSTALKLIARILQPSAGRVVVRGRVAALLELGTGFHPDLSGRENIYLNGSMMGLGRREMGGRLDRIIAFSELERFIDMPVKHYSSGMFMRLAFATAIHLEPEILLVDEVLAVGDQAFQNKCRDRIAALRQAGVTILLVSHDIQAVRELCTEALWLDDGRVRAAGPTDPVVEAYYASIVAHEEARFAAEHAGAAPPAAEPERWGSREVEITAVEVLGPDGAVHPVLTTGEPATIRVHYLAHRRIERPVFGLAVHRADGLHVNGPNTRDALLDIPFVEGAGRLDYLIAALPLLSGTYQVSASCYDSTCTHPYDHHHRRFEFRVRAGSVRERLGAVWFAATWEHLPEAAAPPEDVPATTVEPTLAH
jgi:lipopolysaccharide transport system ATP-binding protein